MLDEWSNDVHYCNELSEQISEISFLYRFVIVDMRFFQRKLLEQLDEVISSKNR